MCRPGMRLSAAASVHTNKPAGWFLARVRAQRTLGDVTLILRKGTTFQGYRHWCAAAAAAGDSGRFCSGKQQPLLVRNSPPGLGLADWADWSRSPVPNLSTAEPGSALIGRPLIGTGSRGQPSAAVLFSGHFGFFTQHRTSGTRAVQSRSASTKSQDAAGADNNTMEVIYRTSCWEFGLEVPGLQSGPP